jgi:hypothetical protein
LSFKRRITGPRNGKKVNNKPIWTRREDPEHARLDKVQEKGKVLHVEQEFGFCNSISPPPAAK